LDIAALAGFSNFFAVVKKTLDKKILPHLHLAASLSTLVPKWSGCPQSRSRPSAKTGEGALALTLVEIISILFSVRACRPRQSRAPQQQNDVRMFELWVLIPGGGINVLKPFSAIGHS